MLEKSSPIPTYLFHFTFEHASFSFPVGYVGHYVAPRKDNTTCLGLENDNDKKKKSEMSAKDVKRTRIISILSGYYSLGQNKEVFSTFFSGHSFV